ncbi:hypothetical protein ANN_11797 [Periplaneta americana]|uniref:SET domain-containing protein n=1 Tax=Periplaneta americana TaxID=6978 RepID=A0ABQ8T7F5_PERAM|nr:hypothetical protein ANN_11797 [Periplaneta americana]
MASNILAMLFVIDGLGVVACPARSPDKLFAWGHMKTDVYLTLITLAQDLAARDNEERPPTLQESHKQGYSCGPKGKSREELNLATVVANELDHLDLFTFPRIFGGDVRGRQVESARVRHHDGTFADEMPVANLHITLPVPLAGRSSTWNPLGDMWNHSCNAHWQELIVSSEVGNTKYMIMSRDENIVRNGNIKIGNLPFEEVEKFKYLGATVTNIYDTREEIKHRINMGNACYYSVEKLLSSSLLSKNMKVRIYKTVILPVVLYGCETWTLTLREEHRLRVFENKVLRKIFGAKRDEVTGEWRKLHNTELHA